MVWGAGPLGGGRGGAALAVLEPELGRDEVGGRRGVHQVRVEIEVRLRLPAEDVHLVLVETFV